MNIKFQAIAFSALIWHLFTGCPVMEPPEPLNISGSIISFFANLTMTKVIAINSKGIVVGEAVPVRDGTDWKWQMPAVAEDGEDGVFWVEMLESPSQMVYYNHGTPEKLEAGKNIILYVNQKYIPIKNGTDLSKIGKDAKYPSNGQYTLIRDIKLGGDWEPLCKSGAVAFSGSLNGNGHTISGLKLADTGNFQYVGLFGYLYGAKIDKLKLVITNTDLELSGASEQGLGALAGVAMDSSINGVEVSGPSKGLKVEKRSGGDFFIGGIAGKLAGSSSISKSAARFSIEVDADSTGAGYLGGIAGYAEQSSGAVTIGISECYSSESITLNLDGTDAYAGGILGFNGDAAEISQCYASGNVSASIKSAIPAGTVAAGGLTGGSYYGTASYGLAGTRSCTFMETVSASSFQNAALISSGELCGVVGAVPAGTASCYRLNVMTISPAQSAGVDAANTVSRSSINAVFFINPMLGWDFANTWVWDGQTGYPVLR
ncbi:MAG: hypothetical protein LBD44_01705 [Spirochaetaceae bacterium]|jgi:hypothetical protein|nr:hypothetical protein [Spirochaetaceae bacterium]